MCGRSVTEFCSEYEDNVTLQQSRSDMLKQNHCRSYCEYAFLYGLRVRVGDEMNHDLHATQAQLTSLEERVTQVLPSIAAAPAAHHELKWLQCELCETPFEGYQIEGVLVCEECDKDDHDDEDLDDDGFLASEQQVNHLLLGVEEEVKVEDEEEWEQMVVGASVCTRGHKLKRQKTDGEFACDVCGGDIPRGDIVFFVARDAITLLAITVLQMGFKDGR